MSIQHLLEDFATDSANGAPFATEREDTELLDSFEQGYKAGWEDAVRAKSEEQSNISSELARTLQDLSFTYHEAHAALLAEIAPVVEHAIMAVVPEIARHSFGLNVAEEITRLASQGDATDVLLHVSAQDLCAVEDALPDPAALPTRIEIDETLLPGQVRLSFDHRERKIDVTEIVANIGEAFSAFVQQAKKETSHG
ncbi:MAG: hypothetical protein OQK00_05075 [Rhodobacteraceae bacterium]|nr:hypothetical protein [Paracoccaceae bacterium]MCW9042496.1 hypothetical protein [Pseudopelagicola sp.]